MDQMGLNLGFGNRLKLMVVIANPVVVQLPMLLVTY